MDKKEFLKMEEKTRFAAQRAPQVLSVPDLLAGPWLAKADSLVLRTGVEKAK
jgi:hypothetical protein